MLNQMHLMHSNQTRSLDERSIQKINEVDSKGKS